MNSTTPTISRLEDYLPYAIPLVVALAGFNWASLIPGEKNAFFVAITFGFFAKFLMGLQQNGWKSWEDLVPTLTISLGFLATTLSADPNYLTYGAIVGFIVKALGYFQDKTHPIEDLLLAVGAFLELYGAFSGNNGVTNAGALIALIGKTVPSLPGPTPPTPAATPPG